MKKTETKKTEKIEKTEKVETKMQKKVDFKKVNDSVKKAGTSVKTFLTPYTNLDRPIFSNFMGGFLKKNIDVIYVIGLIILALLFILNFRTLFCCFSTFLGGLVRVAVVFVIFRLLCEQLSTNKK